MVALAGTRYIPHCVQLVLHRETHNKQLNVALRKAHCGFRVPGCEPSSTPADPAKCSEKSKYVRTWAGKKSAMYFGPGHASL